MEDEPVIDPEVITSLRSIGLLGRLVAVYRRDASKLLEELQAAAAAADAGRLARWAHDLKSASANLGVRRVSRLAADLERAARDGRVVGPRKRVESIARELDLALDEIAQIANGE
ncbi:MAG TPA: Hpt domain-containing protein [Gammaproteobacteria bacterium]|nr:Hpt domain-containing protein [Gammaproteobacteria bacterium]